MSVRVSPVVLLNIADSVQRALSPVGVLRGLDASTPAAPTFVLNSFEVPLLQDGSLDVVFVHERNALMSQIYADEGGIVGCYLVSEALELSPAAQQLVKDLHGSVILVYSPSLSMKKDGKYFRVFSAAGKELKCTISHEGTEAVNTVLSLKEGDSTEITKSKDMVENNKDILQIIHDRVTLLIAQLESGSITNFETLREIHTLVSKLQYKADEDTKKELLNIENTYKLILTAGIVHTTTQSLERITSEARGSGKDPMM